jgi:P27 family predicted phage terminase small subunit
VRGRKPVPTALKIARGNPGQRKISDDEPEPSRAIDLAVPEILAGDPDASAEWTSKAPLLHKLGLLTEVDLDALILYCATFARWKAAARKLQANGLIVTPRRGRTRLLPIVNPYLAISMAAQKECRALLIEFGLTPVSRSRVHVPKKQADDAARERFFGPSRKPA